jgi:hypothetical protein
MARATKLRAKPEEVIEEIEEKVEDKAVEKVVEKKKPKEEPKHFLNLNELRNRKSTELVKMALDLDIEDTSRMTKQDITYAILKAQSEKEGVIFAEGVLEILSEGYGFLRSPKYSYLPGPDDI